MVMPPQARDPSGRSATADGRTPDRGRRHGVPATSGIGMMLRRARHDVDLSGDQLARAKRTIKRRRSFIRHPGGRTPRRDPKTMEHRMTLPIRAAGAPVALAVAALLAAFLEAAPARAQTPPAASTGIAAQ